MSGNSINFEDKKIKISDFYKNKNKKIFNIDGIDVNKILGSKKVSYGKNNSFKVGHDKKCFLFCLKSSFRSQDI